MRQKYVISRNDSKNVLNIREYAITDKNLNKTAFELLQKGSFTFLCEETYEKETILASIKRGMDALSSTLMTPNIYPIEPYANKIAESVMTLYEESKDSDLELYFDDRDLLSA